MCFTNLDGWDHTNIADYDFMQKFVGEKLDKYSTSQKRIESTKHFGDRLRKELHFRIADMNADTSIWFKAVYQNPHRYGVMITEREADRKK